MNIFGEPTQSEIEDRGTLLFYDTIHDKFGLTILIKPDGEARAWFWRRQYLVARETSLECIEEILLDCSDELRDKIIFNLDLFR